LDLQTELLRCEKQVTEYLLDPRFRGWFEPEHLRRAVYSYPTRAGKCLRPAVLLFACGAVGGDESKALPAAAGIELFHTWTLVHDDLIDHDARRRGGPTVHEQGRQMGQEELELTPEQAGHYGDDLAVLTGDVQHAWSVCLFAELAERGVPPEVVLALITRLESQVINAVIGGELLDIRLSCTPIEQLTEDAIVRMLRMKTGALYEFAAAAGAMIGLATPDVRHPWVEAVGRFAGLCGTAFQLQDDLLGLVGDERRLGKPIGSDIREGKRTTIVCHAFRLADPAQQAILNRVLGNRRATETQTAEVVGLLRSLGGIEHTRALAGRYVEQAIPCLDPLPPSASKDLLLAWAKFMVDRTF